MPLTLTSDGRLLSNRYGDLSQADQDHAFLAELGAEVEIEDGTTVADVFQALATHAPAVSAIAAIPFHAWHEALRAGPAPAPMSLDAPGEDGPFSHIALMPVVEIDEPDTLDTPPLQTLRWDVSAALATPHDDPDTGEQISRMAFDFTPPAQWARLPVKIEYGHLRDEIVGHRDIEVQATLFDAILRGLLWEISFHGSPEETAETAEEVRGQIRALGHGGA